MGKEEKSQGEGDEPEHRRRISLWAVPFEKESFPGCVVDLAPKDFHPRETPGKLHLKYLAKYLREIGAKTTIIEEPYHDRYIFRDHWALSADTASGEEYTCARMHFFKNVMDFLQEKRRISLEALSIFIDKSAEEEGENKDYLGFIVIVLRSKKMIGTTCLAPPQLSTEESDESTSTLEIPTTVKYSVNLAGHSLSIKSLAFREQDTVTSACATCALWSTLQKTSRKFGHEGLSPGEITARALKLHSRRDSLPMEMGLTNEDMASAINSISGLRAMVVNLKHWASKHFEQSAEDSAETVTPANLDRSTRISLMLDFIAPLLDHGVPVILTMESVGERASRRLDFCGRHIVHAVSVVGYKAKTDADSTDESSRTKVDRISELVVHDDNIGPFIRLQIKDLSLHYKDLEKLEASIPDQSPLAVIGICHDSIKSYPFLASRLYISVYHTLLDELNRGTEFRSFLASVNIEKVRVWETKIRTSNEYKNELLAVKKIISENEKRLHEMLEQFLLSTLPDYILVLSIKGPIAHDLVFSMAGPWQVKFIQIVPRKSKTIKFFSEVKQATKTLLNRPEMRNNYVFPIIEQISQRSWS